MNTFYQITCKMPSQIEEVLNKLTETEINRTEEIRFRTGQMIRVRCGCTQKKLDYIITNKDLQQILNNIFFYPPAGCTTAELPPEEKNQVSHRANALKVFYNKLKEAGYADK